MTLVIGFCNFCLERVENFCAEKVFFWFLQFFVDESRSKSAAASYCAQWGSQQGRLPLTCPSPAAHLLLPFQFFFFFFYLIFSLFLKWHRHRNRHMKGWKLVVKLMKYIGYTILPSLPLPLLQTVCQKIAIYNFCFLGKLLEARKVSISRKMQASKRDFECNCGQNWLHQGLYRICNKPRYKQQIGCSPQGFNQS